MSRITVTASVIALGLIVGTGVALAQQLTVEMNNISDNGIGEKIGRVDISKTKDGLSFHVVARGTAQGPHGFHVHEKGNCGPAMKDGKMKAGMAAGGHYDPSGKAGHQGPKGGGHRGDLPKLTAAEKGIEQTVTSPKLKLSEVQGRALIIHKGGDTYSDQPKDGGGGDRIACGVIPKK